jgi:hypothetical protein
MNPFAIAAVFAAVSLSTAASQPAAATPAAHLFPFGAQGPAEKAAFVYGMPLVPGGPSRLDRIDAESARVAVESYFDFDALITLGALALGGGAMAAIGVAAARRKPPKPPGEPDQAESGARESVFQALQADLWQFTQGYRRAA